MMDVMAQFGGWELNSLSFAYPGSPPLLKDLSLKLGQREITLIRGDNGCGKSTLLRLMTGELTAKSGSIAYLGKISDSQAFNTDLYYLPQNPVDAVIGITGRDDLKLWKLALKTPGRQTQIDLIMNDPIYEHIIDQPFTKLSMGQLRSMAMAILPCLIDRYWILDEPFAGLDRVATLRLTELLSLKQLSGFPGAVIVSHNHEFVDLRDIREIDLEKC